VSIHRIASVAHSTTADRSWTYVVLAPHEYLHGFSTSDPVPSEGEKLAYSIGGADRLATVQTVVYHADARLAPTVVATED
jgi:hypothetical protein